MLRNEVETRLRYLVEVGLGYLSLDRATKTLSGGEVERVNLTTCLGASLVNALFVMDEPSVGLHPRDVGRLIRVMKNLRDKGNTLLVVEHEETIIRAADNLIELGPGRGEAGGELVFNGPVAKVEKTTGSLTADYLAGRKSFPCRKSGARRNIGSSSKAPQSTTCARSTSDFPLGVFTCVTGVSGSGKSTLVHDVLYQNSFAKRLSAAERRDHHRPLQETRRHAARRERGHGRSIAALAHAAVQPGRVSRRVRSHPGPFRTPAGGRKRGTYCRARFRSIPARAAATAAAGNGFEKIEMQFLSDIFVRCPECDGKRYQPHVLGKLNGKSIHDVLELTVSRKRSVSSASCRKAKRANASCEAARRILEEVGLGYLSSASR